MPCPTINIAPLSLPAGFTGVAYNQTFVASGSTDLPYTYSVTAGALPTNWSLNAGTGVVSCAAVDMVAGSYSFTIRAMDALDCVGSRAYNVVIGSMPSLPTPTTLRDLFLSLLKSLNCCAATKLCDWIKKKCEDDFDDAEQMWNIIDSIVGFVPQGSLLSGTQASTTIIVTSSAGAKSVSLTVGTSVYTFTSNTGTANDFATDIALNINSLYPQSYTYQAVALANSVLIYGSTFDLANGDAVSGSTTNGAIYFSSPSTLLGGIAATYHGENCLTNNEVDIITNKLKSMCGCCN